MEVYIDSTGEIRHTVCRGDEQVVGEAKGHSRALELLWLLASTWLLMLRAMVCVHAVRDVASIDVR